MNNSFETCTVQRHWGNGIEHWEIATLLLGVMSRGFPVRKLVYRVHRLVETMHPKPEDPGFDSRWIH
jgi:hypothetical protein